LAGAAAFAAEALKTHKCSTLLNMQVGFEVGGATMLGDADTST